MPSTTGFTLWFTGMSGAGKSTLANMVTQRLKAIGRKVELLDGDEVREHFSKGLGFSKEDRDTNIKRIGYVAKLLTRNDVVAISAAISPYRDTRDQLRKEIGRFIEVFVDCPVETLMSRDTKGLYKKALAGELPNFTGITDPYEPPTHAELVLHTEQEKPDESLAKIWQTLLDNGVMTTEEVKQASGKKLKAQPKQKAKARKDAAKPAKKAAAARPAKRAVAKPAKKAAKR